MNPSTIFWGEFLGRTAGAVALMVGLAALVSWRIKSAIWRRTLWQIAVAGSLLMLVGELTGASRVLTGWLNSAEFPVPAKSRTVSVQVVTRPAPAEADVPVSESISTSGNQAATPARQPLVGWPGFVWIGGSGLIVAWRLVQGAVFLRFRRRMKRMADGEMADRVGQLASRLGLRRRVCVLESDRLVGPIAFGVRRPAIGLPARFGHDFTPAQQEAMLAHELAHLAAGDPLWQLLGNLLTTLLWWHPLVWWARRQLRVVTELAADEASLLLDEGPDALAESLVALGRRLAVPNAPGWLGVEGMGFRSGLGRRIERLMRLRGELWTGPKPWRARLARTAGVPGLLAVVLGVGAWTQPEPAERTFQQAWEDSLAGQAFAAVAEPASPPPPAQSAAKPDSPEPPIRSQSNVNPEISTNRFPVSPARAALMTKLEQIRLPEIGFDNLPLGEAIQELARLAREQDPDKRGINFIVTSDAARLGNAAGGVDPATGLPRTEESSVSVPAVNVSLARQQNVTLRRALELVLASASTLLKYRVEDYAVVVSRKDKETLVLHTRWFKLDRTRLFRALGLEPEEPPNPQSDPIHLLSTNSVNIIPRFLEHLRGVGVDLTPPKAVFFSDRRGTLMVRATLQDLDAIEEAVQEMAASPQQLTIEIKICEVTKDDQRALGFDWFLGNAPMESIGGHRSGSFIRGSPSPANPSGVFPGPGPSTATPSMADPITGSGLRANGNPITAMTGILTDPQFRVVMRALEQRTGVDILSAPRITTLSGRQAQVKVVDVKYVVTGVDTGSAKDPNQRAGEKNSVSSPGVFSEPVEIGPTIDVVPHVESDGYTIQMDVTATMREFLGYDTEEKPVSDYVPPGNGGPARNREALPPSTPQQSGGSTSKLTSSPEPKPLIRLREATATARVWDGQTLMLSGGSTFLEYKDQGRWKRSPAPPASGAESKQVKAILVFITPTIIDAAGNRLHSDSDLPERQRSVPPQRTPTSK